MYNNIHRDNGYINHLKDFICQKYNIDDIAAIPAKRGYYGDTWRFETSDNVYFIKLDYSPSHQKKFQNSLPVVEYLCNNGIDFISKIVKTCNDELYTIFNSAVVGVFEWIDGENIETDNTKIPEYQMLCKIYPLTKQSFPIPAVEFSDKMAFRFYEKWENFKTAPSSEINDIVRSIFEYHSKEIQHCASRLSHFASLCQKDKSNFYITHGDAGGNFLAGNGRHHIVDWDEVMYASLERDAWVMCCYDWARELFNDTLKQSGIPYELQRERLAFYCYYMFLFYLGEFIDFEHLILHDTQKKKEHIEGYFNWFEERIHFADTI